MFERIRQSYVLDVFFFICSCLLGMAVVIGITWAVYRYPGAPAEAVRARFPDGEVVTSYRKPDSSPRGEKRAGLFLIQNPDGSQVLAVAKPHSVLPTCKVEIRGRIDDPIAEERVTMKVKTSHFKSDSVTVVNGKTLEVENPVYGFTLSLKEYMTMVGTVSTVMVITGYTVVHDIKKRLG